MNEEKIKIRVDEMGVAGISILEEAIRERDAKIAKLGAELATLREAHHIVNNVHAADQIHIDELRKQLAATQEELSMMTSERDSESRWAKEYSDKADKLEAACKKKGKIIVNLQMALVSERVCRNMAEAALATAQDRDRWHFEDPPVRGKTYWCAFEEGQGPCYYGAHGVWFGKDIIAWRELPEHPAEK